MRWLSMNGPFFKERMLLALPLHNELVGSFVVARFITERRHSPRSHGVVPFNSAFATTMWMIDRIHHNTSHGWPNSQVPRASGFSNSDVFVIEIPNLSDRGHAVDVHQADFARRKLHMGIVAFLRHKLRCGAGAARHLSALTRTQLDIVHGRTERNISQR